MIVCENSEDVLSIVVYYKIVAICWDAGAVLVLYRLQLERDSQCFWTQTFEKHCLQVIMLREYMNWTVMTHFNYQCEVLSVW
jgi:hypothetical protein